MKKATKASDNRYYQARFSAAQKNTDFESREAASDVVGIDRTRLARIELGNVTPYADEVVSMSKCYNAPELLQLLLKRMSDWKAYNEGSRD